MLLHKSISLPPDCYLKPLLLVAFWVLTAPAFSATWFVATNGLDVGNTGASNSPFATIMRAQTVASSGDTVYLRGGTYYLDNSNLTFTNSPWVIVNHMTKSGISYIAYTNERPVFDFSAVQPIGWRVTAFYITNAANCLFRGFDVVGVQINIRVGNTQSECFRVNKANNNRFEQLRMHDGMGIGWYLTDGASNLVLNCDAWNNCGLETNSIGNIDGFGCHPSNTNGTGNIMRGCRAWVNSDDGYDCINAFAKVTFDHCWAFYNGYSNSPTGLKSSGGDANGIKAGGYGVSGSKYPTNNIPHHVVEFCLAARNRASGFYANHHLDGQIWLNNTAYRNATDYNMLCSSNNASSAGDVPGYNHVMKNNLGYNATSKETNNLNAALCDVSYNFFTLPVTVTSSDFVTLDESLLTAPRQANGDLPYVNFARLANASDCINVGTNLGFAFYGAAPDLGAFEFGPTNAPDPTIAKLGTNLIFTASGWANRTNYLVASTNLTLAASQWTILATSFSDLAGICAFTNPIPAGVPQTFYRIAVP